jgi:hypothetical protein
MFTSWRDIHYATRARGTKNRRKNRTKIRTKNSDKNLDKYSVENSDENSDKNSDKILDKNSDENSDKNRFCRSKVSNNKKTRILGINLHQPFFHPRLYWKRSPVSVVENQGDQIGRIFAFWAIIWLQNTLSYRSRPMFGGTFFHGKINVSVLTKIGWATFWAICTQTNPVTLLRRQSLKI